MEAKGMEALIHLAIDSLSDLAIDSLSDLAIELFRVISSLDPPIAQ
jgi:hypothetical protein